jgi:hypothetical protein
MMGVGCELECMDGQMIVGRFDGRLLQPAVHDSTWAKSWRRVTLEFQG